MTSSHASARSPLPKENADSLLSARQDFPILQREVHGNPLIYLDNAATTQKPQCVIDALVNYYTATNANVHRGVHHLSQVATEAYEAARVSVQRFIHAERSDEIIFVRGTTEAINLVAQSYVRPRLVAGDEILLTQMEHHSNIVPWQLLAEATGAIIRVLPIDRNGVLQVDSLASLLSARTKFFSLCHVSNALGTINDVKTLIALAHDKGVAVLVDGAQAVSHLAVDVVDLDCDFYAFSGHKACGPTGIGALYGKASALEGMPPYQGGGDMIHEVRFDGSTFSDPPHRFEAGTPHISGAIGFAVALEYLTAFGLEAIRQHEEEVMAYALRALRAVPELTLIGNSPDRAGAISFVISGIHPHDLGTILDQDSVAIRAGHHCAMPVMQFFNIPATARASFALYNTCDDADRLVESLHKARSLFL